MEKPAPTAYPVHDLIRRRWSPRVFSGEAVAARDLCSLFEAARWAPSSFNEQPWSFVLASRDDPDAYERVLTCLSEGNQKWAWHAPVLMLAVARLAFATSGRPNPHALYDLGQAVATLALQATSMGLRIHQMAGFDRAAARAAFAIPDGHEPVSAIAVGHPVIPASLHHDVLAAERRPRERRSLEAFVFSGRWGRTADILR